ncbi:MAG: DUF6249 domain-containing protein [bacterium]
MGVLMFGLLLCFVLALVAMYQDQRRREMEHRERMAAMASGQPWPQPTVSQDPDAAARAYLRRGLIWLFFGIGVFLALTFAAWTLPPSGQDSLRRLAFAGIVPAAVGAAYLVCYANERQRG